MAKTKTADKAPETADAGPLVLDAEKVRKMYLSLGWDVAKDWKADKLLAKVKKLDTVCDDSTKCPDKDLEKLRTKIVKAIADKRDLTFGGDAAPAPAGKPEKSDKSAAKGDKKEAAPTAKKPGVIKTIIECLKGASAKHPITKDQIVVRLVKEFPERAEAAMRSTVNAQVPTGLKAEKDLVVQRDPEGKGYWLP